MVLLVRTGWPLQPVGKNRCFGDSVSCLVDDGQEIEDGSDLI